MAIREIYKHYFISSLKKNKILIIFIAYFILLLLFSLLSGKVEDLMKNRFPNTTFLNELERTFGDIRIVIPFSISMILIPLLTLINTFNVLVNDIKNGTLRYLVQRAKRYEIYLARLLSEISYTIIAVFLSMLFIIIFLSIKGDLAIGYFSYALLPLIILFFYSAAFISLFLMINTFSKSQYSSLFYCFLALFLLILFASINYLKYLSVFYYIPDLTLNSSSEMLKLFGILLFIIITTLIGLRIFDMRDL